MSMPVPMEEISSKDKRKSPRIDFHLSVIVKGQPEIREVRNFGLYGVFLRTEDPYQFKTGDEIYVTMKFPPEKESLQLKASVVHVSERGVGVEFVDVPPKDAMSLEFCFNVFKHTVPLPGS